MNSVATSGALLTICSLCRTIRALCFYFVLFFPLYITVQYSTVHYQQRGGEGGALPYYIFLSFKEKSELI